MAALLPILLYPYTINCIVWLFNNLLTTRRLHVEHQRMPHRLLRLPVNPIHVPQSRQPARCVLQAIPVHPIRGRAGHPLRATQPTMVHLQRLLPFEGEITDLEYHHGIRHLRPTHHLPFGLLHKLLHLRLHRPFDPRLLPRHPSRLRIFRLLSLSPTLLTYLLRSSDRQEQEEIVCLSAFREGECACFVYCRGGCAEGACCCF